MDKDSQLYRSLKWMYQPIQAVKQISEELKYESRRRSKLQENKKAGEFSGLHIGCGSFYLSGWINTDVLGNPSMDFPLDISKLLPFEDNFFDAIYGSEVIEHINLTKGRQFFAEALRILKPGGAIRLTTPDLTESCKIFLGLRDDVKVEDFRTVWLEDEFSKEIWINALFRSWGHQHLWTFESLADELKKAGFSQVDLCEPQKTKSQHHQLNNLDNRYGDNPPPWILQEL
ncbi:MAG: methyltransferase domain-containing protein [Richelia sp. CSU_2_1]|nr:methyltransferase domain-containing protein [Richelia sp. CSU_2_1]